jgi:hypothetical protein
VGVAIVCADDTDHEYDERYRTEFARICLLAKEADCGIKCVRMNSFGPVCVVVVAWPSDAKTTPPLTADHHHEQTDPKFNLAILAPEAPLVHESWLAACKVAKEVVEPGIHLIEVSPTQVVPM